MSSHQSSKAIFFALGGNLMIAIIKYIVAFITGSAAMLAESIHSTADSMNQVLLLVGNKRARKSASEAHSLGYSREVFFWSLIVAVLLFFMGALFSIYEGIEKMLHPEKISSVHWIFIVIGSSILIEAKSFQVAYKEFRRSHTQPLFKAIRQSTDVNLVVVLLEDAGALAGLIVVMISTFLAWKLHPVFDAVGSIVVGALLLFISIVLIIEVKALIIGESISREDRNRMKTILHSFRQVKHVNRLQSMVMGNNKFMILLSVDLEDSLTVYQAEDLIEKIKAKILNEIHGIETIYIDIKDSKRNQQF
jgi:cation diffusion facilitator family transporter